MKKFSKIFLSVLGSILLVILLLAGGLVAFLSAKEYKPADIESVTVENENNAPALQKSDISFLTYNVGYCGLGDNADFFMDGGKNVTSSDSARIESNLVGVLETIKDKNPDFTILQEVDVDSARTNHYNEKDALISSTDMTSAFALNYACPFVPYPLPPIGEVHSGILTLTPYKTTSAERIGLPCPFSWPIRTANLRRCLLVSRIPIANSDKELVLVNLHLEAYDDGEGKIAQTKMLLGILEKEYQKGNYVVAGGDFNQTFTGALEKYPMQNEEYWKPSVLESAELPEGWQYVYDLETPSCRLLNQPYNAQDSTTQHYILDAFITSPNVAVRTVETLDLGFKDADHNPVYMEVILH